LGVFFFQDYLKITVKISTMHPKYIEDTRTIPATTIRVIFVFGCISESHFIFLPLILIEKKIDTYIDTYIVF